MKKLVVFVGVFALTILFSVTAFAWSSPNEMLEHKTDTLQQRVEDGVITAEQAESILEAVQERMENCSGTRAENRERLGQSMGGGLGFGRSDGKGTGRMAQHRGNQ